MALIGDPALAVEWTAAGPDESPLSGELARPGAGQSLDELAYRGLENRLTFP